MEDKINKKIKGLDETAVEQIIEEAKVKAEATAKEIKTNQVRNFYSAVLKIRLNFENKNKQWDEDIETEVLMLKPKLAYAAGRQQKVKEFASFIEQYIEALCISEDKSKALEKFFILLESYVSYHKYFGGE